MKRTIETTIPTSSFGNLRLSYDGVEEWEKEDIVGEIMRMYNTYGETTMKKRDGSFERVETFTGETVLYDDLNHIYKDLDGNRLTSASTYKKLFEKPFDLDMMASKVAVKYGVPVATIKAMWKNNSIISTTFGDMIHKVMEQYYRHKEFACGDKNYHLPKSPLLKDILLSFPLLEANVLPEVMVSNVKEKKVGQIDGIEILGEKECNLLDYKSDVDIDKEKLRIHFIQLSFYADILKSFGWNVNKLKVCNYTSVPAEPWVIYEQDPFDLKELEESQKTSNKK